MSETTQSGSKVESGEWELNDNPLHFALHTLEDIMDSNWEHAYDRNTAAFPVASVKVDKFWPTVNGINDVYGDRNLVCSCAPIEAYVE